MGFVVLGIAAAAMVTGVMILQCVSGHNCKNRSGLQMFNHGISAAAMFFLVGVVYDRAHTRNLDELGGGIWQLAPVYGGY
ncbi:MAG: hypothetical protein CM1200mP6_00730 [Anaerolineaceae bacterium]|nr:MAG: hypothetical protein CM1200mP6_00730 [Anaerolineaceae bacterium]